MATQGGDITTRSMRPRLSAGCDADRSQNCLHALTGVHGRVLYVIFAYHTRIHTRAWTTQEAGWPMDRFTGATGAHSSGREQSMRTAKATARRASSRCITSAYSTASTAGMPLRVMSASCRYPAGRPPCLWQQGAPASNTPPGRGHTLYHAGHI